MIYPDGSYTVGIDECGRGSVMFNVVAAAVIMPDVATLEASDSTLWKQIKDSKKVSPKKRAILATYIKETALAYGVGEATPAEIDRDNILQATFTAMHRALDNMHTNSVAPLEIDKILVDGTSFRKYHNIRHECIIGGDNKVLHIAAASILAKAHHDATVMEVLAKDPSLEKYGIATNMGYGTKAHMDAIKEHGITSHHRKTFLRNIIVA